MAPETVRRPIQLEIMTSSIQKNTFGDSLVVQWLRLHPPSAREQGSIPGQGPRSDRPQLTIPHAATQPQHSQINKYFKKLFKKKTLKKKKKSLNTSVIGHTPAHRWTLPACLSMHTVPHGLKRQLEC